MIQGTRLGVELRPGTATPCLPGRFLFFEVALTKDRAVLEHGLGEGGLAHLQRLQPKGYAIPGVPVLHVVVRDCEYEARFFRNRLAA